MSNGVRKLVTFAHSREVPVFQSSYRDVPFSRISCDDWSRVYLKLTNLRCLEVEEITEFWELLHYNQKIFKQLVFKKKKRDQKVDFEHYITRHCTVISVRLAASASSTRSMKSQQYHPTAHCQSATKYMLVFSLAISKNESSDRLDWDLSKFIQLGKPRRLGQVISYTLYLLQAHPDHISGQWIRR